MDKYSNVDKPYKYPLFANETYNPTVCPTEYAVISTCPIFWWVMILENGDNHKNKTVKKKDNTWYWRWKKNWQKPLSRLQLLNLFQSAMNMGRLSFNGYLNDANNSKYSTASYKMF